MKQRMTGYILPIQFGLVGDVSVGKDDTAESASVDSYRMSRARGD